MSAPGKVFGSIWNAVKAVGRLLLRLTGPVGRFVVRIARKLRGVVTGRPVPVVIALGVVVAVLAVGVGLLWNSDRGHDDEVDARADAVAAAKENVPKVLSYDFEVVDKQLETIEPLLTDPFKGEYSAFFTNNVVPAAKQQQIRTQTVIAAEAVVDGDEDKVITLLFLNQETRTTAGPDPIYTGSRIRVTLEKRGGDWLISELVPL